MRRRGSSSEEQRRATNLLAELHGKLNVKPKKKKPAVRRRRKPPAAPPRERKSRNRRSVSFDGVHLSDFIQKKSRNNKAEWLLGRKTMSHPDLPSIGELSKHRENDTRRVVADASIETMPIVVQSCVRYLKTHGLTKEGIFRINGDLKMCESLLRKYGKKDHGTVNFETILGAGNDKNCRTVASTMKMYFRSLPSPLLPYSLYEYLLRNKSDVEQLRVLLNDRKRMTRHAYEQLRVVMKLCQIISRKSAVNMMSPNALAICWAPSLLRAPQGTEEQMYAAAMDAGKRNKVVRTIIANFDSIFEEEEETVVDDMSDDDDVSMPSSSSSRPPVPKKTTESTLRCHLSSRERSTDRPGRPQKPRKIIVVSMFGGRPKAITKAKLLNSPTCTDGGDEEEEDNEEDNEEEDEEEEEDQEEEEEEEEEGDDESDSDDVVEDNEVENMDDDDDSDCDGGEESEQEYFLPPGEHDSFKSKTSSKSSCIDARVSQDMSSNAAVFSALNASEDEDKEDAKHNDDDNDEKDAQIERRNTRRELTSTQIRTKHLLAELHGKLNTKPKTEKGDGNNNSTKNDEENEPKNIDKSNDCSDLHIFKLNTTENENGNNNSSSNDEDNEHANIDETKDCADLHILSRRSLPIDDVAVSESSSSNGNNEQERDNDVHENTEETEYGHPADKSTPKRRVQPSIRMCPIRRVIVNGLDVPTPPTPADVSEFLMNRPVIIQTRQPGHMVTTQMDVMKTHHGIREFIDLEDCESLTDHSSAVVDNAEKTPTSDDEESVRSSVSVRSAIRERSTSMRSEKLEELVSMNTQEEEMEQSLDTVWKCEHCAFVNTKMFECVICGRQRSRRASSASSKSADLKTVRSVVEEEQVVAAAEKSDAEKSVILNKLDEMNVELSNAQRKIQRLEQRLSMLARQSSRGYYSDRRAAEQQDSDVFFDAKPRAVESEDVSRRYSTIPSVYAQGEALKMSGWSLFASWKRCFCRIDRSNLLVWESREDALRGQRKPRLTVPLLRADIEPYKENRKETVTPSASSPSTGKHACFVIESENGNRFTMMGVSKRNSAYWYSRLKDKTLELALEHFMFERQRSMRGSIHRRDIRAESRLLNFLRSPSAFSSRSRPSQRSLDLSVCDNSIVSSRNTASLGISTLAIRILAESVSSHFYLHQLNLCGSLRGSTQLAMLSEALLSNTSLQRLDVSNNAACFGNGSMPSSFVAAIRRHANLDTLVMENNSIGREEISRLCPSLDRIVTLSLRSNNLGNDGVSVLVEGLRRSRHCALRRLDLARNQISDASQVTLLLSPPHDDDDDDDSRLKQRGIHRQSKIVLRLQDLDLSDNNLNDVGANELASALTKPSAGLKSLRLENNPFTSLGNRVLVQMARENLSLVHLHFGLYKLNIESLSTLRVLYDFGGYF